MSTPANAVQYVFTEKRTIHSTNEILCLILLNFVCKEPTFDPGGLILNYTMLEIVFPSLL